VLRTEERNAKLGFTVETQSTQRFFYPFFSSRPQRLSGEISELVSPPDLARPSWNFDDRAALLASVRSGAIVDGFQFLEFIETLA
jgi:hypothetical protein